MPRRRSPIGPVTVPTELQLDAATHRYYERLADHYHRSVDDWGGSLRRHGAALTELLGRCGVRSGCVLDVACGIGTQSLGLALRGYRVTGLDASAAAVARARREAAVLGVNADFHVADMRKPTEYGPGAFDAVICCDNSLPHMLTEHDVRAALSRMLGATASGGVVLASIRDYDRHMLRRPQATSPEVSAERIVFQRWQWLNERVYRATLFIMSPDADQSWTVDSFDGATFRAWTRAEISALAREVGATATWLEPEAAGYHQHVLVLHNSSDRSPCRIAQRPETPTSSTEVNDAGR